MHTYVYMADTEMRLIIFFAAKDGEAVYSEQKQKGYSPWGRKESDTTERLHIHVHLFWKFHTIFLDGQG